MHPHVAHLNSRQASCMFVLSQFVGNLCGEDQQEIQGYIKNTDKNMSYIFRMTGLAVLYMGKNIFVLHLLIPEFSWQSFLLSTHLHESMNAERLII